MKKILIALLLIGALFIGGCVEESSKSEEGYIVTVVGGNDEKASIDIADYIPELKALRYQAQLLIATIILAIGTILLASISLYTAYFGRKDNLKLQKEVERIRKTLEKIQRNKGKK